MSTRRFYPDDRPDAESLMDTVTQMDTEVSELRHALSLADGILNRLVVGPDWEDAEGVSLAPEWAEYLQALKDAEMSR